MDSWPLWWPTCIRWAKPLNHERFILFKAIFQTHLSASTCNGFSTTALTVCVSSCHVTTPAHFVLRVHIPTYFPHILLFYPSSGQRPQVHSFSQKDTLMLIPRSAYRWHSSRPQFPASQCLLCSRFELGGFSLVHPPHEISIHTAASHKLIK